PSLVLASPCQPCGVSLAVSASRRSRCRRVFSLPRVLVAPALVLSSPSSLVTDSPAPSSSSTRLCRYCSALILFKVHIYFLC
ncbi:hypothetical protein PIB30_114779, partial [Stylosanthes scabra]|nr:hypothetical protein [Stylosanthes scabra]